MLKIIFESTADGLCFDDAVAELFLVNCLPSFSADLIVFDILSLSSVTSHSSCIIVCKYGM